MDANTSHNVELSSAAEFGIDFAIEKLAGKTCAVLTGAGLSTDSGIPDYRGAGRTPKHPMTFEAFLHSFVAQQRYWARSYVGWSRIEMAKPNAGHFALARAEHTSKVSAVITQNVDGLHQVAGSKRVIDLHGRLDRVICLQCSTLFTRRQIELQMQNLNPNVQIDPNVEFTPDGDAEIGATASFVIPKCESCGGTLKPDVVFFGESVPNERLDQAVEVVAESEALVVAGTSLSVNSGMRFVKQALKADKPVVIVNLGPTKGDEFAIAKIDANTSIALERLFGV
jgi:NAD-dependent SIR2 family protein deacetylase